MSRHSRRDFLRTGLAGGALLSLPAATYRSALLADEPPSERVRLGSIGVGNQGGPKNNLKAFVKLAPVVAVCDVDKKYLAEAAAFVEKEQKTAPRTYADYRKLLDAKDVDAVVITVPDHWHALMTVHACQAGKDVYCEKPLTLVVNEGKAMIAAARTNKRVVQTGSQQRSDDRFRRACELVRGGALGKLHTVKVGLPGPNWVDRAKKPVPDSDPPAGLDYDAWLGPAPARPFNANRVHYLFRFFWDYSGGQQTNFGAHHLDIAQWALGMDESGPTAIEGSATFNKDGWFETPETAKITYTYANGVKVLCALGKGGYPGGCTFEGEKGTLFVDRGKITATPKELLDAPTDVKLYVGKNHHQNWLDCIRSRKTPIADVAIGHRSATVCHLGNIAIRTGRKITWDPAKEEIVGDSEAGKLLTKEYRKPWSLT
jgi:predicted dehydrogenase